MSRLVVRSHNPHRVRFVTVLLVAAAVGSGWGLFEYGRHRGGYDAIRAGAEQARLAGIAAERDMQVRRLREGLAVVERSRDIEQEAYRHLEVSVATLQDEILELQEELAFYRGIVSPNNGNEGLRLQNFQVTRGASQQLWRYRLVLTQVLKNDTVASGSVKISLDGVDGEVARRLPLGELTADGKGELHFRFKYFQDLEGELMLPDGFRPLKIGIVIEPEGKKYERLEETFDWPAEET